MITFYDEKTALEGKWDFYGGCLHTETEPAKACRDNGYILIGIFQWKRNKKYKKMRAPTLMR